MKPNESLFNTYGYLEGRSSMDLKPGMRLKIERAYFRPAKARNEEHDTKTFLGVSTMYLDVEVAGNSKIRFRRVGSIRYSPASLAHKEVVFRAAWQGDGKTLATCGSGIFLWDVTAIDRIQPLAVLKGHQSNVTDVAFSAEGDLLASASWDGTVRLWDR